MIYKIIKRIFDFVCAFLGIVGTSPIWIVSIILTVVVSLIDKEPSDEVKAMFDEAKKDLAK